MYKYIAPTIYFPYNLPFLDFIGIASLPLSVFEPKKLSNRQTEKCMGKNIHFAQDKNFLRKIRSNIKKSKHKKIWHDVQHTKRPIAAPISS